MARIRAIKPGFFTNEHLAELPMAARLLFIGLWTQADREGRLEDRPKRLKAELFPYDALNVHEMLDKLFQAGFIVRYQAVVNGVELALIQIVNFTKHQQVNVKENASTLPAPDEHHASTMPALQEGKGTGREHEGKGTGTQGAREQKFTKDWFLDEDSFKTELATLLLMDEFKELGAEWVLKQRIACIDWLRSHNKKYSDYRSFFRNWLRKDWNKPTANNGKSNGTHPKQGQESDQQRAERIAREVAESIERSPFK